MDIFCRMALGVMMIGVGLGLLDIEQTIPGDQMLAIIGAGVAVGGGIMVFVQGLLGLIRS